MFCSLWLFMALKSISFTEAMTFSPLLYDPHVLQWDYSCKASSAHAEALRKTGVTLYWPISEISCLALHFGPWETSSQQPHHFLLCQFLNPSRKDAAWKVSCLDFSAYVHVPQVFELPLQSVWFGQKFSWPAIARQQQVCCDHWCVKEFILLPFQ